MSPVEHIPEADRDLEAVIRDQHARMENARAAFELERERWLELNAQAGHPVDERPFSRWGAG